MSVKYFRPAVPTKVPFLTESELQDGVKKAEKRNKSHMTLLCS